MSDEIHPLMARLTVGAKIADFRLAEEIGQGGMAVVFRAQDERLGRWVALKVLVPEQAGNAAFRERFIRESRAAASVDHPNIVPVYDANEAQGFLFIAMRYVRGGDAGSLLQRLGPLPASRAWSIVAQVASALDASHARSLVHRDVKPANILLDTVTGAGEPATPSAASADRDHVYLADFGISKQALASDLTATGQFVGTLDYTAPEELEGRVLDGRADMYSLACTAFALLSGSPPFRHDAGAAVMSAHLHAPPPSLAARRASLPSGVDPVFARALAKNPAERYATCMEFVAALGRALEVTAAQPALPVPQFMPDGAGARSPGLPEATLPRRDPVTPALELPTTVTSVPLAGAAGQQGGPGQPPPPARPRWRSPAVLAGSAIAILVIAGVTLALLSGIFRTPASQASASSGSPPSQSPSPSAALVAREAAKVDSFLTASQAAHLTLKQGLHDMQACSNPSGGVALLQEAETARSTELRQLPSLAMGALPNGAAMKADLQAVFSNAVPSEQAYIAWAKQDLQAGCTPEPAPGNVYSVRAEAPKHRFLDLWNQVAPRHGLPVRYDF